MAKKTLNEAAIRRFQRLAKVAPLTEMYHAKRDEEMEEGMHAKDEGMHKEEMHEDMHEEAEEEVEMDAGEAEMEMDADGSDLELTDEEAEILIALGKKLEAAMGESEEVEMDAEEAPMEMDAAAEEEEEMMEALAGINLQATNEEIVNEVANRVAKRLKAAKLHEAKLNKALGRK